MNDNRYNKKIKEIKEINMPWGHDLNELRSFRGPTNYFHNKS